MEGELMWMRKYNYFIIFRWSSCSSLATESILSPSFLKAPPISFLIFPISFLTPLISLRSCVEVSSNRLFCDRSCPDFVRWDIAVAKDAIETGASTNSLFGFPFTLTFGSGINECSPSTYKILAKGERKWRWEMKGLWTMKAIKSRR